MTNSKIQEEAEKFCMENGISSIPVEIIRICNDLGIKVFETYIEENISGLVVVDEKKWEKYDSDKFILVNLSESPARRRFTIAHELAHYVLHRDGQKLYAHRDMKAGSENKAKIESEANYFAANILMPESEVKRCVEEWKMEVGKIPTFILTKKIADTFVVSESAAGVRLRQLGII